MRRFSASLLAVWCCSCGPQVADAVFEVAPVSLTPCGWKATAPASVRLGASIAVPLGATRSDMTFTVSQVDDGVARVDGGVLEVTAPFDSFGSSVAVQLEVLCAGKRETGRVEVPIERQVKWAQPITWAAAAGPSEREHPSLFIDDAAPDALWLFGGFTFEPRQFTVVNDLWRLDLVTNQWALVDTTNAPMVAGGRIVAGLRPSEFLLVGGQTPTNTFSTQVFRFDVSQRPVRFEVVQTMGSAPAVGLQGMALDKARERLISFGGYTETGIATGVQTLTLGASPSWSTTTPPLSPSPRYGFFSAVDRDRLIVFSGGQAGTAGNPVNAAKDTWALSFSTLQWTKLVDAAQGPPARRNGCGAIDPLTHRFYVWSGTPDAVREEASLSVLELDQGSRWSTIVMNPAAPARGSCSAVFDAPRRRVLFGFGNTISARYADLQVLKVD